MGRAPTGDVREGRKTKRENYKGSNIIWGKSQQLTGSWGNPEESNTTGSAGKEAVKREEAQGGKKEIVVES